jgi:hypothetical protein
LTLPKIVLEAGGYKGRKQHAQYSAKEGGKGGDEYITQGGII